MHVAEVRLSGVSEAVTHRNAAGDVVGPHRECFTAKGEPKRVFANETEAQAVDPNARVYTCSHGHLHLGNRREPAKRDVEAAEMPSKPHTEAFLAVRDRLLAMARDMASNNE